MKKGFWAAMAAKVSALAAVEATKGCKGCAKQRLVEERRLDPARQHAAGAERGRAGIRKSSRRSKSHLRRRSHSQYDVPVSRAQRKSRVWRHEAGQQNDLDAHVDYKPIRMPDQRFWRPGGVAGVTTPGQNMGGAANRQRRPGLRRAH